MGSRHLHDLFLKFIQLLPVYQDGIFYDMRELAYLEVPFLHGRYCTSSYDVDKCANTVARLHKTLTPWLETHSFARLPTLFQCLPRMQSMVAFDAIWHGDVPLLQSLLALGHRFEGHLLDVASHENQFAVLQLLHGHTGCTTDTMDWAAGHGNLDMIQFLHQRRTEGCTDAALSDALRGGHVDVAVYLLDHHLAVLNPNVQDIMEHAARHGHLNTLQWLANRQLGRMGAKIWENAAYGNHLPILQWLQATNQAGFSVKCISSATSRLHFDVAHFLMNHCNVIASTTLTVRPNGGTPRAVDVFPDGELGRLASGIMTTAAGAGQLELLQWLHENKSVDMLPAVQLEVLTWLLEDQEIKCTVTAMDVAARSGQLATVQWLHANTMAGCSTLAVNWAAENGHLPVVQWLLSNRAEGCTADAMNGAAANGHLEMVKWLHANRSDGCTTYAMDKAAENGHLEIVQWLRQHRTEGCSENALHGAAIQGNVLMARYLAANQLVTDPDCPSWAEVAARERHHKVTARVLSRFRKRKCRCDWCRQLGIQRNVIFVCECRPFIQVALR
ncbi:Aste57867_23595 [Aphanomyces stellatus]|uniref:Aste57867_23595 protein n=1 Tax=Aphanomyces stellatus TaxID=120398 RepID=A0A485LNH4_9STRA|nr:hypothetical protein As57867_023523 [Aphanomyces stellatus]VFU00240.1 Aste57867_23595 [Aphanomyces stellatus]